MSKKLEDYFIPFESTAFEEPIPQEEVDAIMADRTSPDLVLI